MQEPQEAGASGDVGLDPWVRKIPWRREWQPTPVFLPGEFHGQKSLEGYSPWGHKESDTKEQLSTHAQISKYNDVGIQALNKFVPSVFHLSILRVLITRCQNCLDELCSNCEKKLQRAHRENKE